MTVLSGVPWICDQVDGEQKGFRERTYRPRSASSLLIRFSAMSGCVIWVFADEVRRRGWGAAEFKDVSALPVEGRRIGMNQPAESRYGGDTGRLQKKSRRELLVNSKGLPRNRSAERNNALCRGRCRRRGDGIRSCRKLGCKRKVRGGKVGGSTKAV